MRTYKELAAEMEKKINEAISLGNVETEVICGLIDGWLAFSERDSETPKEEKKKKHVKIAEYLEQRIEGLELSDCKRDNGIMMLVFAYVAVRQNIEESEDGRKASALRLVP